VAGGRNETVELERRLELARYLKDIMDRAGYRTQAELARDVGVEASRISHWLKGEDRGLSAYSLLEIIRAAERRQAGASEIPARSASSLLRSLEVTVDQAGADVTRALKGVQRRLQRIEVALQIEVPHATEGRDG